MKLKYKIKITPNKDLYHYNQDKAMGGTLRGLSAGYENYAAAHTDKRNAIRSGDLTLTRLTHWKTWEITRQSARELDDENIVIDQGTDEYYGRMGYASAIAITGGDDPIKPKAQGGGGLNSTNDWLGYAGYAEGAIGAGQIGMLGYRQSLSISSRIGTFGSFSSTYRALGITGKVLGRIGYVGAVTNTIVDFNSMQSGEIGCGRFAYRTAGTLGSIGGSIAIGASMGGPWGAVGGAVIGGASWAGEKAYDGYMYLQSQMSIYMTNLENGLKSGWVPGR